MLRNLLQDVLSEGEALLWPRRCPGCGAAGPWCQGCRPCDPPTLRALGSGALVAVGARYEDGTAAALRSWKLGGRTDLTAHLAPLLVAAIRLLSVGGVPLVLAPVPLRPSSARRRGADLVAAVAGAAARELPGCRVQPLLRWQRPVGEQVGGTFRERLGNVASAMVAAGVPPRVPIVVVDDIMTSGATIAEGIRALCAAGADPVAAAVLAAAAPPDSGAPWRTAGG